MRLSFIIKTPKRHTTNILRTRYFSIFLAFHNSCRDCRREIRKSLKRRFFGNSMYFFQECHNFGPAPTDCIHVNKKESHVHHYTKSCSTPKLVFIYLLEAILELNSWEKQKVRLRIWSADVERWRLTILFCKYWYILNKQIVLVDTILDIKLQMQQRQCIKFTLRLHNIWTI